MKKLTLEERIERLEDRYLGRLCYSCHREMLDYEGRGGVCDICNHDGLEDEE